MGNLDLFSCSGKTAIVTGGAGLYGYAISEALCEAGADVIVASRSDALFKEKCADLKKRCSICHYKLDLTDEAAINSFFDRVNADFSGADILVNNAVTPFGRSIDNTTRGEWEAAFAGNAISLMMIVSKSHGSHGEEEKRSNNKHIVHLGHGIARLRCVQTGGYAAKPNSIQLYKGWP